MLDSHLSYEEKPKSILDWKVKELRNKSIVTVEASRPRRSYMGIGRKDEGKVAKAI